MKKLDTKQVHNGSLVKKDAKKVVFGARFRKKICIFAPRKAKKRN
nr:hypothetical protein [uncultured Prevotella sp.]